MAILRDLIYAIELIQPVINKTELDEARVDSYSVQRVESLSSADGESVAFLSNVKYLDELAASCAGVILISQKFYDKAQDIAKSLPNPPIFVVVKDAYLAHASISTLFEYQSNQHFHQTAQIAKSAKIGSNVSIGAYSVIGENACIGDNTVIGTHATIEDCVSIGSECFIGNHVSISHHCVLGDNVRIHTGASIGSDGFGFAPKLTENGMAWQRIAQLGRVVIGSNVRIGSQTCIDRGAVDDTVIGDNVIIDNLVQIAHNVKIGSGTAIAASTGIAGSTTIGKNCIIGGAVGIAGHIFIADGVTLTGMAMVTNSIKESGTYSSGTPAMPSMAWRRAAVKFRQSGDK